MYGNANASEYWALHGRLAELRAGDLAARVDISHPELGLHDLQLSKQKLADRLLCVFQQTEASEHEAPKRRADLTWPLPIADAYVRGGDLVTSYEPTDVWPYMAQIYWCADKAGSVDGLIGSLSLLVSVQTHLLDTCPRFGVGSHLACSETVQVTAGEGKRLQAQPLTSNGSVPKSAGPCCIVRRLADLPISYAEIMPASDFRNVTVWRDDAGCYVEWELFADFLEKGVIRRARLQSAFLPRENDLQLAADCCEALEQCRLPLTT